MGAFHECAVAIVRCSIEPLAWSGWPSERKKWRRSNHAAFQRQRIMITQQHDLVLQEDRLESSKPHLSCRSSRRSEDAVDSVVRTRAIASRAIPQARPANVQAPRSRNAANRSDLNHRHWASGGP